MTNNVLITLLQSSAGRYIGMVLTFLTMSLIAHKLSVTDLGMYSISFGLASSFCYLVGIGIPEGLVKVIEKNYSNNRSRHNLIFNAHLLSILSGVFVIIITLIISFLSWLDSNHASTIIWCVAWGCNISAAHSLVALKKERLGAMFFYSLTALCSSSVAIISVLLGTTEISIIITRTAVAFSLLSMISTCVLFLHIQEKSSIRMISLNDAKKLLTTGLPFTLGRVIQACILWIPVWLSGFYYTKEASGIVAALIRLGVAFGAAMSATRFVLKRWFVQLIQEKKIVLLGDILSSFGTLISAISLSGAVLMLLIGDIVLALMFGSGIGQYYWLMSIILLGISIEALFGASEDLLKNSNGMSKTLKLQLACLAIQITSTIFLMMIFEWPGVIYGYILQLIVYQYFITKWLRADLAIYIRPNFSMKSLSLLFKTKH